MIKTDVADCIPASYCATEIMDGCTSTEERRDFGECQQQPDLEQIVRSHSVPVFLESDTLAEVATMTNDFSEIGLTVPSGEILLEQDPMLSIGKCSTCDSELQLVVSEELQRYNVVEQSGSGLKAGAGGAEADVESAFKHSVMLRDDGMLFDLENGLNSSPVRRETVGLESGRSIVREKSDKTISHGDKVCRVCHLGFDVQLGNGSAIELGCSCKDDLAAAHLHCAEAWFKIKGNR
eukprot:c22434_g1_i2 orf=939-1646(+)